MNVESVVGIILNADLNSDLNLSEEKDCFKETLKLERLSMGQQGKTADKRAVSLYTFVLWEQ